MIFAINNEFYIDRGATALLLGVSIHMLAVWKSNENHTILHEGFLKKRGKCLYKLSEVENFLKGWDTERYYDIYTTDGRGFINYLART